MSRILWCFCFWCVCLFILFYFLLRTCFLVCMMMVVMMIVVMSHSGELEGNLEENRSLYLTLAARKAPLIASLLLPPQPLSHTVCTAPTSSSRASKGMGFVPAAPASITWAKMETGAPGPTESESKISGWFVCMLKFEEHHMEFYESLYFLFILSFPSRPRRPPHSCLCLILELSERGKGVNFSFSGLWIFCVGLPEKTQSFWHT